MTVISKLQANAERNKEIEKRQKMIRKEKRRPHPLGAQSDTRCQKTSSVAGARGIARPRARAADDLSAQGRGLCARQAKGSSHAPEIPTPTPAINLDDEPQIPHRERRLVSIQGGPT